MKQAFLLLSICLTAPVFADTVALKNGKELKGLVVEQHADRIVLSTEGGELPILRSGVKEIQFADPEQNFLQAGRAYEAQDKLGEALAYYEKALQLNPDFEEARQAALGVRNRFWSMAAEGPRGEIEKRQDIYDSWQKGVVLSEEAIQEKQKAQAKTLKENFGITLEKKGDWVEISSVESKKDGALSGLKTGDRLISIDGESLRYLDPPAIEPKFLAPRYASFTLEFDRDVFLRRDGWKEFGDLGLKLALKYEGIRVTGLKESQAAARSGLKDNDLIMMVNGQSTRYMPLRQVRKLVKNGEAPTAFTVRRSASLTRR